MKAFRALYESSALTPAENYTVEFPASWDFEQFSNVLKHSKDRGETLTPVINNPDKVLSPLEQKAFYDALRAGEESAKRLHQQLVEIQTVRRTAEEAEEFKKFGSLAGILPDMLQDWIHDLRTKCKAEKEFLKTNFNIFASKYPLEKVTQTLGNFDTHCRENGITFDEASRQLVAGDKPKTPMDHVREMRFALAAIGGAVAGVAGLDLGTVPVVKDSVGLFFNTGLPWLAAGFISLNMYKAFSETSIIKESGTLGRFSAVTAAGFGISYLVVNAMNGVLPPVDINGMKELTDSVISGDGGFNPMQYMLYLVGGATALAATHKGALSSLQGTFNTPANDALARTRNILGKVIFNDRTVSPVLAVGDMAKRGAEFFSTAFPIFINYVGIPAVATVMSQTMANGGVEQLADYSNYYITAFTGLGAGGLAMMGAYYAAGCRGQDFKQAASAFKEGFFISSSSAVLPKERICLLKMGASEKTTDSVLPLAGVFNMYGTSLYLGLTAFYALNMFNSDPTLSDYLATASAAFVIAMGAPGIPASNIALLDPVLQQTGLATSQIHKIYAMVVPMDRLLDMSQTGLNVLGDMMGAIWKDSALIRAKNEIGLLPGTSSGEDDNDGTAKKRAAIVAGISSNTRDRHP